MQNRSSIDISVPREKVWPLLTQPDKILLWYYLLKKAGYTSPQKSGTGSTLYFEDHFGGSYLKIHFLVTLWEENQALILKMTTINSSLIKGLEQKWTLESIPSGCRFTFTETVRPAWGFVGESIGFFMSVYIRSNLKKVLLKLKTVAEAASV